jgi:hypothetical protein
LLVTLTAPTTTINKPRRRSPHVGKHNDAEPDHVVIRNDVQQVAPYTAPLDRYGATQHARALERHRATGAGRSCAISVAPAWPGARSPSGEAILCGSVAEAQLRAPAGTGPGT